MCDGKVNFFDIRTVCYYNLYELEGCDFLRDALHTGEIASYHNEKQR